MANLAVTVTLTVWLLDADTDADADDEYELLTDADLLAEPVTLPDALLVIVSLPLTDTVPDCVLDDVSVTLTLAVTVALTVAVLDADTDADADDEGSSYRGCICLLDGCSILLSYRRSLITGKIETENAVTDSP